MLDAILNGLTPSVFVSNTAQLSTHWQLLNWEINPQISILGIFRIVSSIGTAELNWHKKLFSASLTIIYTWIPEPVANLEFPLLCISSPKYSTWELREVCIDKQRTLNLLRIVSLFPFQTLDMGPFLYMKNEILFDFWKILRFIWFCTVM